MNEDVAKYVKECEICKETKAPNQSQRSPMGQRRESKYPWHIISVDFMGPFPLSKNKNRQLLVVVDHFSKYVLLKPMTVACAKETIEFLKENVIFQFGTPEFLIMDNGSQFKSKLFDGFLSEHKIKPWYTSHYHPQANPTEAANKTVINAIKAYIEGHEDHINWDKNLRAIRCAFNTAKHTVTQESPYFINYGREMTLHGIDHSLLDPMNQNTRTSEQEFIEISQKVSQCLQLSYQNAKKLYDKGKRDIEYQPGQIVWRKLHTLSDAGKRFSKKLAPRYEKCRIRQKIGTNTYTVEDLGGKLIGDLNTAELKA